MAYWWVSQNKTFSHEREGGFIWAPLSDKGGRTPHHRQNVASVKPGDVIFSYVRGAIVARGEAETEVYHAPKPAGFDHEDVWENQGRRVDVAYFDLKVPLVVRDIADELAPHLSTKYSPLTARFTGVQGYLFVLPEEAGLFLERHIARSC